MPFVIRDGVFETNSSSCHSIVLEIRGPKRDKLPISREGKCVIQAGQFGWGVDEFKDAYHKASYCLTWAMSFFKGSVQWKYTRKLIEAISQHMGIEENQIEFKMVSKERNWDGDEDWGYIDHASDSVCEGVFESVDRLKAFIFNKKSILRIDNDNKEYDTLNEVYLPYEGPFVVKKNGVVEKRKDRLKV